MAVASCVSMSKEQCETTRWSSKGREDAYAGKSMDELGRYQKMCTKHSVGVDKEKYYDGFQKGLVSFCTVERAKSFGLSGGVYRGQCPKKLEKNFIREYELSYREYKLDKREQEIKEQAEHLEDRQNDGKWTLRQIIALNTGRKCSFDSDCRIKDECSLNRCEKSGKQCNFNSDCNYDGDCSFSRCEYN